MESENISTRLTDSLLLCDQGERLTEWTAEGTNVLATEEEAQNTLAQLQLTLKEKGSIQPHNTRIHMHTSILSQNQQKG